MPIWNVSRKGGLGYLINAQRKLENNSRSYNRHNQNFKKKNTRTLEKIERRNIYDFIKLR